MKYFLREYFTFNRRERNGVFVLLSIILVLILYLSFSDLLYTSSQTDFLKFEKEVTEFETALKQVEDSAGSQRRSFSFSGNRPVEEFQEGTTDEVIVDINSADTAELKRIRGIGSVFANRIVKFRQSLGGFVAPAQLLEVYGFDREKLARVSSQITVDAAAVKKLNVNTASVEDLNMHPYVSKKEAVAIFTKRVKAGDYADIQEVKKAALMNDSTFSKIVPYLTL